MAVKRVHKKTLRKNKNKNINRKFSKCISNYKNKIRGGGWGSEAKHQIKHMESRES